MERSRFNKPYKPLWKKHSLQANIFQCPGFQFKELRDNRCIFLNKYRKNWQAEKITQLKRSNTPFIYNSLSDVNYNSIQATIK